VAGVAGSVRQARQRTARGGPAVRQPAATLPVAQVAVDVSLPHLDRLFEYLVPEALAAAAVPGCRVRVRFAGRLTGGFLLQRTAESEHQGRLGYLERVVSPEPVLTPEIAGLARAVADRYGGTLADVLRLAIPPRHGRAEAAVPAPPPAAVPQTGGPETPAAEPAATPLTATPAPPAPAPVTPPPTLPPTATSPITPLASTPPPAAPSAVTSAPGPWSRYPAGPSFLAALAAGRSPRAVWSALPGACWPTEIALAVAATASSGRGAVELAVPVVPVVPVAGRT